MREDTTATRRNYVLRSGPRGGAQWYAVQPDRRYRSGFRETRVSRRPQFSVGDELLDLSTPRVPRRYRAGHGGRFGTLQGVPLGAAALYGRPAAPRPRPAAPRPRPAAPRPRRSYVLRSAPRGGAQWYAVQPDRRHHERFRETALPGCPPFRAGDELLDLTGAELRRYTSGRGGRWGCMREAPVTTAAAIYAAESVVRHSGKVDSVDAWRLHPYAINPATGWRQRWANPGTMRAFLTQERYTAARGGLKEHQGDAALCLGLADEDTGDIESVVIVLGAADWETGGSSAAELLGITASPARKKTTKKATKKKTPTTVRKRGKV